MFHNGDTDKVDKMVSLGCIQLQHQLSHFLEEDPFRVVYGRPIPSMISYEAKVAVVGAIDNLLKDRDEMSKDLKATLERTQ